MGDPFRIHGQTIEITVVACYKLKNTEWLSRQDPYVLLDYASTKHRTRTCTDGGKNPTFNEKFMIRLIEGVHEIDVSVWNSNTVTRDDYIGNGRALLNKVLCEGYDDMTVHLQTARGRYAGEVKLMMHCPHALKMARDEAMAAQLNHGAPPVNPPYNRVPPQAYAPVYMFAPPSPLYHYPPNAFAPPSPLYHYPPNAFAPPSSLHPYSYSTYPPQGYTPSPAPIYPPVAPPGYNPPPPSAPCGFYPG